MSFAGSMTGSFMYVLCIDICLLHRRSVNGHTATPQKQRSRCVLVRNTWCAQYGYTKKCTIGCPSIRVRFQLAWACGRFVWCNPVCIYRFARTVYLVCPCLPSRRPDAVFEIASIAYSRVRSLQELLLMPRSPLWS